MKVVHVVNGVGPGSIPLELAARLAREGVDVELIVYYRAKSADKKEAKDFLRYLPVHEVRAAGPLDLSGIIRLYRKIKNISPEVLHVHHNMSGSLARVVGRFAGVPLLVDTEHNDHAGFERLPRIVNGISLNLADRIICNSENTCSSFFAWEDFLIRGDKKTVIYNGVDVEKIDGARRGKDDARRALGLAESDFVIGNVGMLTEQKDQASLVKAMGKISDVIPESKLVIVGDGPLRSELEAKAGEMGLGDEIIFTGLLERKRVYQLLQVFDVFCMVSLWEGFCNALVEAMAAENPVVVSEVEPLPEVVGEMGIFIRPGDSENIADAVVDLYRNPGKAEKIASEGRIRAESKFSLARAAEKYRELYLNSVAETKQ